MKKWQIILAVPTALCLVGAFFIFVVYVYQASQLPNIEGITQYEPRLITTIYADDGKIAAEFSDEKRRPLAFEEIPKHLVNAFLAAEDESFYSHSGINLFTIFRAFIRNLQAGRTVQGGSTITQQVVKSILLTPEKSYSRKIKEVMISLEIEKKLSKDQILELYFNHIFLGAGSYGVEAASQTYFGKSARDIDIAEAAILAGLPRAPSRDNPINNPNNAKKRQAYVLGRMRTAKFIDEDQYFSAMALPVKIYNRKIKSVYYGDYFVEHVRRFLLKEYGKEAVYKGGLKVYTSMNLAAQMAAEKAIHNGLEVIDKRAGLRPPRKNLDSKEQRIEFLAKQHLSLVKEKFDYKILTPDGKHNLPTETIDLDSPLEHDRNYEALLVNKDRRSKNLIIKIGNREGVIEASDYQWASLANYAEVYKFKKLRKPYTDLKIGDIITVVWKGEKKKKNFFALGQEPLVQGALYSYNHTNNTIISIVGGYDFGKSQFNRAIQAYRQSGSAFKPFIYAMGLEHGLTPSTIIVDSPIVYNSLDEQTQFEKVWKPDNYGKKFHGDTLYRDALAYSRNIPTIKLLQHLGIQKVVSRLNKFKFSNELNPDLSLALGSSTLSLQELVNAWGIFPNKGIFKKPYYIHKIVDRNGDIIFDHKAELEEEKVLDQILTGDSSNKKENTDNEETPENQIISEDNAYLMTSMLESVVRRGTASKALKDFKYPAAGKTGTTNDFIDALFVGFTKDIMTGVWVGFDSNTPIGPNEPGGRAAAPIWKEYMEVASINSDVKANILEQPDNIIEMIIDTETGDRPLPTTLKRRKEFFVKGTAPGETPINELTDPELYSINKTQVITGHKKLNIDSDVQKEENLNTDELFRDEL